MRLHKVISNSLSAVVLVPAALSSVALSAGCDLLGIPSEVEIPVPLDTPSVDIDVGAAVGEAVSQACGDPTAASCEGIALICKANNDGTDCDPVELPPEFPAECPNLAGDPVSAKDLLPDAVKDAAEVKFAIPVDLAEQLSAAGVSSADQVKQIGFKKIDLLWEANTLTFDAPVLDVYVGPKVDDVSDPAALVATADFRKVGTVGKDLDGDDTFDVGQEAGVADAVPLTFVEGGNDAFNEALRAFTFTIVFAAPEGQALALKEVADSDPLKVARPDGLGTIKLQSELTFKVNFAEALQSE
jgi:hypothetical protein